MKWRNPVAYGAALLAVVIGSVLSLRLGLGSESADWILQELRIPRLLLALGVGGGLAVSGLLLQTTLGNPLAEPYTLGVASGAAIGAALTLALGEHFGWEFGAWVGAGVVMLLLLRSLNRAGHQGESLILTGVMISLLLAGVLSLWMTLAEPAGVRALQFWLLGDLGRGTRFSGGLILGFGLLSLPIGMKYARRLDAFLFGEAEVEGFGVPLVRTRAIAVIWVSAMVGLCVSAAGMIGFVGLLIPHWVRRLRGSSLHFHLIPLCWLWGAALLSAGDAIARSVAEPRELPVGAVLVILGVPGFLWIQTRRASGVRS